MKVYFMLSTLNIIIISDSMLKTQLRHKCKVGILPVILLYILFQFYCSVIRKFYQSKFNLQTESFIYSAGKYSQSEVINSTSRFFHCSQ